MNTKSITVSKKTKDKLEEAGVVVGHDKEGLPDHLAAIFENQESVFGMYSITVNLDKYDDFHPIHAML